MKDPDDDKRNAIVIGRYALHRQIARGGMATIHIARVVGDKGFSRIVAAKRLHPEFATDPEFVAMFLDEARVASRVHHRNVVPVLDVVTAEDEVILVQEYVLGASLHSLLDQASREAASVPVNIAVSIACQVLSGLAAVHATTDENGEPLDVIHRDVSPQNVMIATDGTARLLDFGIAKTACAAHITKKGTFKGKIAYSAPEQLRGKATRQSDIYSLSVMLWETVVGRRMHRGCDEGEIVLAVMDGRIPTITEALAYERETGMLTDDHWRQLEAIAPIIQRGLARDPAERWQTAAEMEEALAAALAPAPPAFVAAWLRSLGKDLLEHTDKVIADEEASWRQARAFVALEPTRRRTSLVRRIPSAAIAVAGSIALACGLFLLWRGPSAPLAAAAEATLPQTCEIPPGLLAAPAPAAAPATPTTPAAAPAPVEATAPRPAPPHRAHHRHAHRSAAYCATPFYYRGTKKIFKLSCL